MKKKMVNSGLKWLNIKFVNVWSLIKQIRVVDRSSKTQPQVVEFFHKLTKIRVNPCTSTPAYTVLNKIKNQIKCDAKS